MLLDAWLARASAVRADVPAVIADEGVLTYAELEAAAGGIGAGLRGAGVAPGDHVGLAMPPGLGFASALHGVLRAGAVAVPIDARLRAGERALRAASCVLVLDGDVPRAAGGVEPPAGNPLAPAVVIHTSGTTAVPTPVVLTHGNWWWSAAGSAVALGHDPGERWLCALPLSHVGGLSILVRAAIGGTTAVLHRRFDAERVAGELTATDGPTLISVVPTMLARLLDAGLRRPPALRAALVGGGPIPPVLLERARAAGVRCVTTYGLTEACSQVTTGGPPLFCTRVRIAPGGEILVAGPTVAPAATAADGWLHTGDLGALAGDGTLTVTGRAADTIVTGGENVAPAEVEAVLERHPAVAEAAVHARPDASWGEAVVATVVLRAGMHASASDLRDHARAHLAGFKVPKDVAFAAALPRTPSGKLLRREL